MLIPDLQGLLFARELADDILAFSPACPRFLICKMILQVSTNTDHPTVTMNSTVSLALEQTHPCTSLYMNGSGKDDSDTFDESAGYFMELHVWRATESWKSRSLISRFYLH